MTKPNFRAEANRLTGCRGMEDDSFSEEVRTALELAYNRGIYDYFQGIAIQEDCGMGSIINDNRN